MRRGWIVGIGLLLGLVGAGALAQDEGPEDPPLPVFDALFKLSIVPSEKSAHVSLELGSGSEVVEWIRFRFDPLRHRSIEADGELVEHEDRLEWRPPKGGGTLRYVFSIDHVRDDNAFDARCTKGWAIFRGQDVIPEMRIRTVPVARSRSRMRLVLPEGWTAAVPYRRLVGGLYDLNNSRTRFDRPLGWLAFGELGVVRENLAGMRVAIAGPAGQGVRRMDVLALLKWTMPSLEALFGGLPDRLQIVIAGDPMWRGGLSGPRSVFVHRDRPLIEQNGSSPLLHELVHTLMRARSGRDGDWVVEGLAEYYSIALLRRSETISTRRYEIAIENVRRAAAEGGELLVPQVDAATRAKAVTVLMEIDEGIRAATAGARSLDDVVRLLSESRKEITTDDFKAAVGETAGGDLDEIFDRALSSRPADRNGVAGRPIPRVPDASGRRLGS